MSDMKCPFCNGELVGTIGHPICRNQNCVMCDDPMPQDLLEELIRTRKALEEIKKHNKAMQSVLGEQIPEKSTDIEEYCWWASCRIQDCLNTLEQIEHKE